MLWRETQDHENGADARGYFIWALLDNLEWGAGYANRLGIVYVDHATQQRIMKSSAYCYCGSIRADKKDFFQESRACKQFRVVETGA